jgi:uncharacterized protein YecE (DUF72 family)
MRHRGWVENDALSATLAYFRDRKLIWVALELPQLRSPSLLPPIDEVTHPRIAYMRLHGRNCHFLKAKDAAARHHYDYRTTDLKEIAARIQTLAARAKHVHVSVNNHSEDFAPKAALRLRHLLGQRVRTSPPHLPLRKRPNGTVMR